MNGSNQLSVNFDSTNLKFRTVIAYGSIDIDDYANFSDLLTDPIIITGHFYCLILMVILILIDSSNFSVRLAASNIGVGPADPDPDVMGRIKSIRILFQSHLHSCF